LASGSNRRQMATVFISGRMETDTRVSGRTVSNTGKAAISSLWVTFTRASTNLVSLMASASTNGKIKANTQANFSTD
jgi:hypothetical protein